MESIAIQYIRSYGERGSSTGQFEYPRGITPVGDSVGVCDTQNNRIVATDLISTFSDIGASVLSFPDSIYYGSNVYYVSDSENHRIALFTVSGTFITSYGTRGSGNGEFDYPSGIAIDGDYIYVADRQNNRVQKLLKADGTYVSEVGGFLLPEGVCVLGDYVYIMDSGNASLRKYDKDLNFITQKNDFIEGYGTRVENIGGVLCVVDNIDAVLYFLNSELIPIRSFTENLWFPEGVAYSNGNFYVTQPHEVRVYSMVIEFGLQYLDTFQQLNQQLYPTGRAWWRPKGSVFSNFHEALSLSDSRLYSTIINTQNALYADNNNISDIDIEHWEEVFGIIGNGTTADRINLIKQRMAYPGNVLARQTKGYIESQLQLAGFNVYVHYSGTYNPTSAIHGNFVFGEVVHGQVFDLFSICANNVQEDRDDDFNLGIYTRSLFYIGGENLGDVADVSSVRKNEFRELILTLKPAHTVAALYINYI